MDLLYSILKLRADVFIAEQRSCCPDIDGRDLDAGTVHLVVAEDGKVLSTVRIMDIDSCAPRIGRVATAAEARGRGLGLDLTRHAQWLARQVGCEQTVLAVDAANEPAIRTYIAAGFREFDRKTVWIRALTNSRSA